MENLFTSAGKKEFKNSMKKSKLISRGLIIQELLSATTMRLYYNLFLFQFRIFQHGYQAFCVVKVQRQDQ